MSNIFSGNPFVKISELGETIEFDSSDEFVVVNDSVTQKITGLNLTESIVSIGNLASRAYVNAVVDGAPALLDTLNELAAALNDDANFATTITTLIGTKLASNDFNSYFDTALSAKTTTNVTEGTNLFYTQARFNSALAAKTTSDVAEGSNLYWTQARFDSALGSKSTSDTSEGSNLYYTQARFDAALAAKTTADVSEGDNLYFTEQRVLDVINSLPPDPADRLINGEKEVVLQSNGYIRLVNGAQLYDYGSGTGNGYGITDAANSTYIGYDPSDTLGALHMDSYSGGNIRIRTTTLPNTYKDWLFSADGKLTLPADPTSNSHAATKGYVDTQFNSFESFSGSYNDLTDKPTTPTYTSVTTTDLNVQNVTFTGSGAVSFTSGNDLNFVAAGVITFNSAVSLGTDGKLTLLVAPTSDNHAATKGYVDTLVNTIVAGGGYATTGYVAQEIAAASLDGGTF